MFVAVVVRRRRWMRILRVRRHRCWLQSVIQSLFVWLNAKQFQNVRLIVFALETATICQSQDNDDIPGKHYRSIEHQIFYLQLQIMVQNVWHSENILLIILPIYSFQECVSTVTELWKKSSDLFTGCDNVLKEIVYSYYKDQSFYDKNPYFEFHNTSPWNRECRIEFHPNIHFYAKNSTVTGNSCRLECGFLL